MAAELPVVLDVLSDDLESCFFFWRRRQFLLLAAAASRPIQILLGNFSATFRILRNFFVREQLLATFWKTSTFLVTFRLFNLF